MIRLIPKPHRMNAAKQLQGGGKIVTAWKDRHLLELKTINSMSMKKRNPYREEVQGLRFN